MYLSSTALIFSPSIVTSGPWRRDRAMTKNIEAIQSKVIDMPLQYITQ
jgi:hypothetical protein